MILNIISSIRVFIFIEPGHVWWYIVHKKTNKLNTPYDKTQEA